MQANLVLPYAACGSLIVVYKVEAAYRRGDLFEKRRQLMSAWARYCGTATTGADIVALAAGL
jgi:hypothetical protein